MIGHLCTNSSSGFADAEQRASWAASAAATGTRIREFGHAEIDRIPVHPRRAKRVPAAVRAALVADAALHDPRGIAGTLEFTNPHASMRDRLTENARPACLIVGSREQRFERHARYAAEHMPNLKIAPVDAGHGLNMEAPDAFNRAVGDFVSECRTS